MTPASPTLPPLPKPYDTSPIPKFSASQMNAHATAAILSDRAGRGDAAGCLKWSGDRCGLKCANADAERYRWLRDVPCSNNRLPHLTQYAKQPDENYVHRVDAGWDAAIDAARDAAPVAQPPATAGAVSDTEDFLADVYDQCCAAIKPAVDRGLLPGSVVKSLQILVAEKLATQPPAPVQQAEAVASEPTWHKDYITLTALQLRHALDFAAPDFDVDEDQRETQVSIAWAPHGATHTDEGDPDPAGYKVWLTDYPEEGSIPLDESPAGFPVKSAERGRAIAAAAQATIDALRAENERLRTAVKKANSQAEHFEREWYLRGDELERLKAAQDDQARKG